MGSGVPPANRRSYMHLSQLPSWWLLDENKKLIASVRAEDADVARSIFKRAGHVGKWIRKGRTI
jgi:hypothetical protein